MRRLSLQNLAAGMAHTIYRNTDIVEDSHSKSAVMINFIVQFIKPYKNELNKFKNTII